MTPVLLLLRKRFSPWNEILKRLVNTADTLGKKILQAWGGGKELQKEECQKC